MGCAVGDDGGSNQIGVAPGAEWIGCRAWDESVGTSLSLVTECLQWMLAPTDLSGANADPSKAPDVINNSWVCEPSEGCGDPLVLQTIVQNLRAAGIAVVAGAGNDGSGCSSIVYPPAIYEESFSVGSTSIDDQLSFFSSRGPVTIDGSGRLKPNVVAPGQNIRSSTPDGGYENGWSGTSLASPHVAGIMALLISANEELRGQVHALEDILEQTAVPIVVAQTCDGIPGSSFPNPMVGYGRVDAFAAYEEALLFTVADVPETPEPGEDPAGWAARELEVRAVPNPSLGAARIELNLRISGTLDIDIFDAAGRMVRALVSGQTVSEGVHAWRWDGRVESGTSAPSGTYYARVRWEASAAMSPGDANHRASTVRLVLAR